MAGVATAYQLAVRRGVARVTLVDPRDPLSLTSANGTEAYRNYWPGPDAAMVRLMDRSIDLLEALDRDSDQAFELNRRGYVFLTADTTEAARLQRHAGPGASFVDAAREILARYPFVQPAVVAMLHVRRAGYLNAKRLGEWLLAQACSEGVLLVRDELTSIVSDNGALSVQLRSGARIDTGALVLAPGPLLPQWTARLGISVPIVNELHAKVAFDDDQGVVARDAPLLIWNDPVDLGAFGRFPPGVHLRPRGERTVLGIWSYDTPRIEHAVFPPAYPPDYADIVIGGLAAMVPGLSVYRADARRAVVDGGYYCKAPDNRPLIGPTAIPSVYLVGGLSGFGVMASQAAADLVSAYLCGNALPDYAGAFHPARFDDPGYATTLAALGPNSGQL